MSEIHRSNRRWTVFYFDLRPKGITRHLTTGEAIRHLKKVTGWKIYFERCEVRGMYPKFREPPRTKYVWDKGDTCRLMSFSVKEGREAKLDLVEEILIGGLEHYRGLPDDVFDSQVEVIKAALKAQDEGGDPAPLVAQLHDRFQMYFETRASDFRSNLGMDPESPPDWRAVGQNGRR